MLVMKGLAATGCTAFGVCAAVFFDGGFFSVAADVDDPQVVNWSLAHVRNASIARHAVDAANDASVPLMTRSA